MADSRLTLSLMLDTFAICRLDSSAAIPDWADGGGFFSITRTEDELSIVCPQANVADEINIEKGWRCLKVEGPIAFSMTGILVSLAAPLAEACISIFVVSTFDTDYLMVKESHLERTIRVLTESGHTIHRQPNEPS